MNCAHCGATVRRDEAVWLLPPWPNTWNTQNSLAFHPEHAPKAAPPALTVPRPFWGAVCSDLPEESCSDAGCPLHGAS